MLSQIERVSGRHPWRAETVLRGDIGQDLAVTHHLCVVFFNERFDDGFFGMAPVVLSLGRVGAHSAYARVLLVWECTVLCEMQVCADGCLR